MSDHNATQPTPEQLARWDAAMERHRAELKAEKALWDGLSEAVKNEFRSRHREAIATLKQRTEDLLYAVSVARAELPETVQLARAAYMQATFDLNDARMYADWKRTEEEGS